MKNNIEFTKIPFGKFEGKTFPQVIFIDPDWFFYMMSMNAFAASPRLQAEAKLICARAMSIRVPQRGSERRVAEYWTFYKDGSFTTMQLVPESQPPIEHGGFRKDVIDLSVPFRLKSYDKLGNQIMLKCVRRILFGKKRIRMTKEKCEEFFLNDKNFILS